MKPLSQTRQAIIERVVKRFGEITWMKYTEEMNSKFTKELDNALSDYTREIIRVVEGKKIKEPGDIDLTKPGTYQFFVEYLKHPSGMIEIKSFNEALNDIKEELNDTK